MKLKNPFPQEVRELWRDSWQCMECGQNGTSTGGLEIHHIVGRTSSCAINSCLLCHECHSHIGHSKEEEQKLFARSVIYLVSRGYNLSEKDYNFLQQNNHLWAENNGFLWEKLRG